MGWYSMQDSRGGGWAVNPDGIAHVLRSTAYNRTLLQRASLVRVNHGWNMPTTTEVQVNFNGIRDESTRFASAAILDATSNVAADPRGIYEFLVRAREDGENAGGEYRRMVQQASAESARAIQSTVNFWESAETVAKFTRDVCAGALLIGASVLTGGTAAAGATAIGGTTLGTGTALAGTLAAGTGLTFTGNTQDNLAAGQTMRQAMGNAAISTSIAVVTNVLVPAGMGRVSRGMTGVAASGLPARSLTMGENVVLGLVTTQANIAGDMIKTALTADAAGPAVAQQMQRQVLARTGFEIGSMVFSSWLSSRGIPAAAFLQNSEDAANTVAGAMLSAIGDRVVSAMSQQDQQARQALPGGARPGDLDLALTQLQRVVAAESYIREVAMRPQNGVR